MFIRLFDARAEVNMLLPIQQILSVKDYIKDGHPTYENAKSVVMTKPIGDQNVTFNYFVSESVTDIEALINNALSDF